MNLEGRTTRLRALEPGDIDLMYAWENDTAVWSVSGTLAPFSPAHARTVHSGTAVRHLSDPPAAARHRNPRRPPRRGARLFRAGPDQPPGRHRNPDPRRRAARQRLCVGCRGDGMPLRPRGAEPAPALVQRRFRQRPQPETLRQSGDSPKSASNATGYGGRAATAMKFCCRKSSDKRSQYNPPHNAPPMTTPVSGFSAPAGNIGLLTPHPPHSRGQSTQNP